MHPLMFAAVLVASAATTWLLFLTCQTCLEIASSPAASWSIRSAVVIAAVRDLLKGATLVALCLALYRAAAAFFAALRLLERPRGARPGLMEEIGRARLAGPDFTLALIVFCGRSCWASILILSLITTLNQLLAVACDWGADGRFPAGAWPGGYWPWLVAASLPIAAVKFAGGLLSVAAISLLFASLSPYMKFPVLSPVLVFLALAWQVAGCAPAWLAAIPVYYLDWDWIPVVMLAPANASLLAAGLVFTAVLSLQGCSGRPAFQPVRQPLARHTPLLAVAAVVALFLLPYLAAPVGATHPNAVQDLSALLRYTWPMHGPLWATQAVCLAPPVTLINLTGAVKEPSAAQLCLALGGRAVLALLLPLGLCLIFAGQTCRAMEMHRRLPQ
jgi:hypothetical protein